MLQHWYLEIDERKAAPVTLEAFRDLIEWYFLDEDHPGMSPPLALGWDIHNKFGADGFAIWRDLMLTYEPPFLASELMPGDQRTAVTLEQYEAALDDAAYKAWILAGEPIGKALKYDRWKKRRLYERRRAALDELQAMGLKTMRIHVAADSTDAECEAASAEEEKFRATWHWHNDHLWPELIDAAPPLAPGTPMTAPNLAADLFVSSRDFIAGFVQPEYLIDGTVQRRYFYSM